MKHIIKAFASIVAMLVLFMGCGGDDPSPPSPSQENIGKGSFVFGPVEGLEYRSSIYTGITDPKGSFSFAPGESVTFFIGNVMLGKVPAKPIMSPLDLVADAVDENHQAVINIARFLLFLDIDDNFDNGIYISSEVRSALASAQYINFNQTAEDFINDLNLKALVKELNSSITHRERAISEEAEAAECLRAIFKLYPHITVKSPNGKEFVSTTPLWQDRCHC